MLKTDKYIKINLTNMKRYKDASHYVLVLGIGVLLLLSSVALYAQQSVKDNQLWQGINLEYKANDNLTFNLSDQVRLNQNIAKFQLNLINFEAIYKTSKILRIASGYRFSLMPVVDRHRLYVEPQLRHEIKKINTKIRLHTKFQYEFDKRQNNTTHLRPMLFAQYEPEFPDRIEPFLATELFYRLSPDSNADQFRIYTGLDYKFTKEIIIRVAYIHARNFNVELPIHSNIFFASLNVEIDPPKKKKKS